VDLSFQKEGGLTGDLDAIAQQIAEEFAASGRNLASAKRCPA
jgi:hypothetical protein